MIAGVATAAVGGVAVKAYSKDLPKEGNRNMANAGGERVLDMWPEIQWIKSKTVRSQVIDCWMRAFTKSKLSPSDLYTMPFSIKIPDCNVSFMAHKRCVVRVSYDSAKNMSDLFSSALKIDIDTLVAGAILADVGKLLEYEIVNSVPVMSHHGGYVRHPISGAALAMQSGLSDEITHIVATHSSEGDFVRRSTESQIVHYSDYMCTYPFVEIAKEKLKDKILSSDLSSYITGQVIRVDGGM